MSDYPYRKIAFVLAGTDHGTLIVNRFDQQTDPQGLGFGVGYKILNEASHELAEISVGHFVLDMRRKMFGDGVVAVDCGANIGTHAVSWARQMTNWGSVVAIEAQEKIYYALAGNVALNNCFNVRAINAAVGNLMGKMNIPTLDYRAPASFGSLELRPARHPEDIGQTVDYAEAHLISVDAITVDSLALERIDFLKIDVEGMELDVLAGASQSIPRSRPVILVEHLKTGLEDIVKFLKTLDYRMSELGLNILAVHPTDPTFETMRTQARFVR